MRYKITGAQIDTFESWYKNVLFFSDKLIIPYVNVGVSAESVGIKKSDLIYFDLAYLLFEHVSSLSVSVQNMRFIVVGSDPWNCQDAAGGNYLDSDTHIFNDMYISSENVYLLVPESAKQSLKPWNYLQMKNSPDYAIVFEKHFDHQLRFDE